MKVYDVAPPRAASKAFSLVELSIVLVILGLLAGGVLSGQSLIRAAELRSVSSDMARYQTAIATFRDKYFALPGDMPNATAFWGAAHTTLDTCKTTASTGKLTCNGDGNGSIGRGTGNCYERHRFWQHLANAGLVEGSFSGIAGPAGECHATLTTNPPNTMRSRLSNAGFSVTGDASEMIPENHATYFAGPYSTRLFFGAQKDSQASAMFGDALKGEEAWNVDTKLDDGKPAYGNVQTYKNASQWGSQKCATTAVNTTAEYALQESGIICGLMLIVF